MSNPNPQPKPTSDENFFEDDFAITQVNPNTTPVRAADVVAELLPQGQAVKAEDLVNHDLVIHHMKPFEGEYGKALYVVGTDENGVVFNTVFGGKVICPKLWACRERLPVALRLVHRDGGQFGGYYDFE